MRYPSSSTKGLSTKTRDLKFRIVAAAATLTACLGAALLVAWMAAPKPSAALSAPPLAQSSPSRSPGSPQQAACQSLQQASFDLSTPDAVLATQDSLNNALKFLPQHDPLGSDILVVEQNLVSAATDLVGVDSGLPAYGQQYADDVQSVDFDLHQVSADCSQYGAYFQVRVTSAS